MRPKTIAEIIVWAARHAARALEGAIWNERIEEAIEAIRAGRPIPPGLTKAEKRRVVRELCTEFPSHVLAKALDLSPRTVRYWASPYRETARAKRNDEIVRLYNEGVSVREIAERFNLSQRWVREIIRTRKRGKRMAWHRLF